MHSFIKGSLAITLATVMTAGSAVVRADSVSGSLGAAPGSSTPVNLNSFDSFAYYGFVATGDTVPQTDTSNVGGFTAITAANTQGINGNGTTTTANNDNGVIQLSFSNSGATVTNGTSFYNVGAYPNAATSPYPSLSISSTLYAASETFSIYLSNYDTASDFNVTLNGSSLYAATDVVLPTLYGTANSTGTGNTYGILSLTVSGSVGEVLTFTDTVDTTGVGTSKYPNIGINGIAVSASSVPEPSSWLLMVTGCIGLGIVRRLKFSRV